MGMGHGTTARELIIAKAMRAHSSVESVQPRIDGIGTRRNRREHLVESASRRQQFGQCHSSRRQLAFALSARFNRPNRHR